MLFRKKKPAVNPLEQVVVEYSKSDQQRVRQWLKGTLALGGTGSGKTYFVGMEHARGILKLRQRSGGLIRAAKDTDLAMWVQVFEEANRLDDLIICDLSGSARFNFLDFMLAQGGTARDVVHALSVISETVKGGEGKSSQEPFWESAKDRKLHLSVVALMLAGEKLTGNNLQRFLTSSAQSPEDLVSTEWREKYHNQCLMRAHAKRKTPLEDHDYGLVTDYFLNENVVMAPKTRSSILAHVMNVTSPFNTGTVRQLLSTTTNVSPLTMFEGKWVITNLPFGQDNNFINAAWIYGTQRAILRRVAKPGDCVVTIWLDEYQLSANSFDPIFMAQSRSRLGCMFCMTQSVDGVYAQFKSRTGKNEADSLMANFGTKIVCATDPHSAEFASKWLGDERQISIGGSMAPQMSLTDELMGNSRFTGSFSESWQPILRPNAFMSGLRAGGPGNKVDAIIIRNSEPFSSGLPYLKATFTAR